MSELILRNRTPVFMWVFMGIWLGMLGVFTYLYFRDGGMPDTDPWLGAGIMLLFWTFGAGFSYHLLSMPVVSVSIENGQLVVRERRLWSINDSRFDRLSPHAIRIINDRDSDGDPYYRCEIALGESRRVTVAESHQQEAVEAAKSRLNEAVLRLGPRKA